MKTCLLILLVAVAGSHGYVYEKDTFEETYQLLKTAPEAPLNERTSKSVVQNVLDTVRDIMANGLSILGIPPLDPLVQEQFDFQFDSPLLAMHIRGYDAVMAGISDFVVDKVVTSRADLTFEFQIRIPSLVIKASLYDLAGGIYGVFPIYGEGGVLIDIKDITFSGRAYLKRASNLISIEVISIEDADFLIGSIDSKLTGLLGGGDLDNVVNAIIEDLVPMYTTRFRHLFVGPSLPPLITVINRVLRYFPTWVLTFLFD